MAIVDNEKELEDYLYNEAKINDGKWSDYFTDGKIFRQVNITGYGIIDLLYVDFEIPEQDFDYPEVRITIIELKKGQIGYKALEQIARYRTAVERYLNALNEKNPKKFTYTVNGFLVGNEIDIHSDFVYLLNNIEWLTALTYFISFDEGLILSEPQRGWYDKRENFDSLKVQLTETMPAFLKSYKMWSSYALRVKRDKQHIVKAT